MKKYKKYTSVLTLCVLLLLPPLSLFAQTSAPSEDLAALASLHKSILTEKLKREAQLKLDLENAVSEALKSAKLDTKSTVPNSIVQTSMILTKEATTTRTMVAIINMEMVPYLSYDQMMPKDLFDGAIATLSQSVSSENKDAIVSYMQNAYNSYHNLVEIERVKKETGENFGYTSKSSAINDWYYGELTNLFTSRGMVSCLSVQYETEKEFKKYERDALATISRKEQEKNLLLLHEKTKKTFSHLQELAALYAEDPVYLYRLALQDPLFKNKVPSDYYEALMNYQKAAQGTDVYASYKKDPAYVKLLADVSAGYTKKNECESNNALISAKLFKNSSAGSASNTAKAPMTSPLVTNFANNKQMQGEGSGTLSCLIPTTGFKSLYLGSKDKNVLPLQKRLVALGYLNATPNGYYGNATKKAVTAFQKANNIKPTGTVGTVSLAKMNAMCGL